jgi:superfamily II DNA/RNA helicase
VVIFSEWTTMTYLIGKQLSRASIPFVELSGKIPVDKRQPLIDEFTTNPQCRVFLSTDAGGTGLNLQAADCVINFELPWNPAKLSQRKGRVNRIGQKSKCVNVVNLIAKSSIEERILAGLQLKQDLFEGVFDGGADTVEFSREKRTEILNTLREMMGDEPLLPASDQRPREELPEDTPYYLNPQVLQEEAEDAAYGAREDLPYRSGKDLGEPGEAVDSPACLNAQGEENLEGWQGTQRGQGMSEASPVPVQSPERLEQVMNSGLQFISGLLEMATGQKLSPLADGQNLIHVDRQTGEVTMKFKLPGF